MVENVHNGAEAVTASLMLGTIVSYRPRADSYRKNKYSSKRELLGYCNAAISEPLVFPVISLRPTGGRNSSLAFDAWPRRQAHEKR
jgi:hypothetical protein